MFWKSLWRRWGRSLWSRSTCFEQRLTGSLYLENSITSSGNTGWSLQNLQHCTNRQNTRSHKRRSGPTYVIKVCRYRVRLPYPDLMNERINVHDLNWLLTPARHRMGMPGYSHCYEKKWRVGHAVRRTHRRTKGAETLEGISRLNTPEQKNGLLPDYRIEGPTRHILNARLHTISLIRDRDSSHAKMSHTKTWALVRMDVSKPVLLHGFCSGLPRNGIGRVYMMLLHKWFEPSYDMRVLNPTLQNATASLGFKQGKCQSDLSSILTISPIQRHPSRSDTDFILKKARNANHTLSKKEALSGLSLQSRFTAMIFAAWRIGRH